MESSPEQLCALLKTQFEGREAIYTEAGFWRVRVSRITANVDARFIEAKIDIITTPGISSHGLLPFHPESWSISGGSLTSFSDHGWVMGYGMWSLHFNPGLVNAVRDLAATWPDDLRYIDRYRRALDCISQHNSPTSVPYRCVFPD